MRQLGKLPTESEAQRLAAWLVTQRIEAHAEADGSEWAVWVRDEDHLAEAREALAHFREHPQDERYRGAESAAERKRREDQRQLERARGNVVEMRGRWGSGVGGAARRCPLVLALIGICILSALATNTAFKSNAPNNSIVRQILFFDPAVVVTPEGTVDVWTSVRRGELWRLVTPVFLHYGLMHLAFNLFWLFDLGGQIENRRGTWYMLLFVLAIAVLANVGQALESSVRQEIQRFGGMSGVGYGIFGYLLVKVRMGNHESYTLHPTTVFIGLLWFVLCLARDFAETSGWLSFMPNIANSAHVVGLFAGMAIAYVPIALRGSEKA